VRGSRHLKQSETSLGAARLYYRCTTPSGAGAGGRCQRGASAGFRVVVLMRVLIQLRPPLRSDTRAHFLPDCFGCPRWLRLAGLRHALPSFLALAPCLVTFFLTVLCCIGLCLCCVVVLLCCCVVVLLGCWVVVLLGCCVVGLLGCWVVGLLGCVERWTTAMSTLVVLRLL